MRDLLKIVVGLAVIGGLGAVIAYLPKWKAARDRQLLVETPLRTTQQTYDSGEVRGTRTTFSIGSFGVTDIGNLRLAFDGWSFSGESSGSVTLHATGRKGGGGGTSGVGKRRFSHRFQNGVEHCQFAGTLFWIDSGRLHYRDRDFDVLGPKKLVIIGSDRRVTEVVELKPAPKQ